MFLKEHFTAKNIIFLILVIILIKFVSSIRDIAMLFFACYVLACSLNPLVALLEKKMRRPIATSIVLTGAVFATFAFFIPIFTIAIKQFSAFVKTFPSKLALIQDYIHGLNIYGHKFSEYIDLNGIFGSGNDIAHGVINQSLNITIGVFQSIIVFIAIITILFYFIKDTAYIKEKFIEFFPEKIKAKAEDISSKISNKVGGYVIAQLISNTAIWILMAILLAILKIDYAFSLGLISGLLDIIPVLGPTIALTLIIVTAYPQGLFTIILAIASFLIVQQISNNLIRPIVFGKFMDLHPLVIIFALFVGGQFLGIFGVIFAPAIAAIVTVLVDELYLKTINKVK